MVSVAVDNAVIVAVCHDEVDEHIEDVTCQDLGIRSLVTVRIVVLQQLLEQEDQLRFHVQVLCYCLRVLIHQSRERFEDFYYAPRHLEEEVIDH